MQNTAFIPIRWKTVTVVLKPCQDYPYTSYVTGEMDFFHASGDINLKYISEWAKWNYETEILEPIRIPLPFKNSQRIIFKKDCIAAVICKETRTD